MNNTKNCTVTLLRPARIALLAMALLLTGTMDSLAQPMTVERSIPIDFSRSNPWLRIGPDIHGNAVNRRDFNGDQVPDMVAVGDINNDGVPDIIVTSGSNHSQSWRLTIDGLDVALYSFVGFYNLDGIVDDSNPKELVFGRRASPSAITFQDILISSFANSGPAPTQPLGIIAILIGIMDNDQDGRDEIVLANAGSKRIESWGWN